MSVNLALNSGEMQHCCDPTTGSCVKWNSLLSSTDICRTCIVKTDTESLIAGLFSLGFHLVYNRSSSCFVKCSGLRKVTFMPPHGLIYLIFNFSSARSATIAILLRSDTAFSGPSSCSCRGACSPLLVLPTPPLLLPSHNALYNVNTFTKYRGVCEWTADRLCV